MQNHEFTGGKDYVLDPELSKIVNASIKLEMPLLIKGEPGTGKTLLAHAIAQNLSIPLIILNVKSSMKAVEALYQYDTLTRLNDSRFADSKRDVSNIEHYIKMGKIGQAFACEEKVVLLIDEIDKADTDFQDDLLDVLDQMSFDIIEIDKTLRAKNRPIIIITSNAKKDLSDPFLGRCVFHHIAFPDAEMMDAIVHAHFPDLDKKLSRGLHRGILPLAQYPGYREEACHQRAHQLDQDPDHGQEFRPEASLQERYPLPGCVVQKERRLQDRAAAGHRHVLMNKG